MCVSYNKVSFKVYYYLSYAEPSNGPMTALRVEFRFFRILQGFSCRHKAKIVILPGEHGGSCGLC